MTVIGRDPDRHTRIMKSSKNKRKEQQLLTTDHVMLALELGGLGKMTLEVITTLLKIN